MTETVDPHEVDELLASMDPTPALQPQVTEVSVELPGAEELGLVAAGRPRTPHETTQRKPTGSTPRGSPRLKSERSVSSSSSLANCGLLVVPANNEPPPTASAPRATTHLSPAIATEVVPCDLDALAELLRTESQTFAPQRIAGDPHTPLVGEGQSALVSSAHNSLSFAPHSPSPVRRSMTLQTQASFTLSGLLPQARSSSASEDQLDEYLSHQLQSPRSPPWLSKQNISPSRRRLTICTHEISAHALERLGVNTDILKKEKGMKKLGISDLDIERFEEIRRYSGMAFGLSPTTKVEFMFGFTKEQLLRVKALNRLGTTEQEVEDEYSRQISRLGVHDVSIAQN